MRVFIIRGKKIPVLVGLVAVVIMVAMFATSFITGTVTVSSSSTLYPIKSVESEEKVIAITFDGTNENYMFEETLGILDKYDAKATFFVTKEFAGSAFLSLKNLSYYGHQIGISGREDEDLSGLSVDQLLVELGDTENFVTTFTEQEITLARPITGTFTSVQISSAMSEGYMVVSADVCATEMDGGDPQTLAEKMVAVTEPGDIICFEMGVETEIYALDYYLSSMSELGYSFVLVEDLILYENFSVSSDGTQYSSVS